MLFQGSSAEISHYLGPENLVVQNILWNNHWLGVLWMASRLRLLQASSICRARSDLAVLLSWPVHSVFSCPFICIRDHDLFATLSLHRRGFWISKAVFHSPFLFLLVAFLRGCQGHRFKVCLTKPCHVFPLFNACYRQWGQSCVNLSLFFQVFGPGTKSVTHWPLSHLFIACLWDLTRV